MNRTVTTKTSKKEEIVVNEIPWDNNKLKDKFENILIRLQACSSGGNLRAEQLFGVFTGCVTETIVG